MLVPTLRKHMDEQRKLSHKVKNVADRANRKIRVFLLSYSVAKPKSSYAELQFFAGNKEDVKFQQIVYEIYKLGENICLLDVMNSIHNKVFTSQPICKVL